MHNNITRYIYTIIYYKKLLCMHNNITWYILNLVRSNYLVRSKTNCCACASPKK